VKIVREVKLISCGKFAKSKVWERARKKLHKAIKRVEWPSGSGKFTIYPESGKKRGMGNGVTPIKSGLMLDLKDQGYRLEAAALLTNNRRFGKFDAVLDTAYGPVVVEWETGNISSSHRSLNKMALFLLEGRIAAGTLIVPTRALYTYLTDRVGNMQELEPYLELWKSIPCKNGILEIVAIEHDATSKNVARITKTTAGRALA
jgi:Restriction endonuclease BamHI